MDDYLDYEITYDDLKKAVFPPKNEKSSGRDVLIAEIYKQSFDEMSPFILKLFNRIFSNSEYPVSRGDGIIEPIFKGGDIEDTKNYRGVTLINVLAKIFSQVLMNRLTKWTHENEGILMNQFGFQNGKSTTDRIFLLHSIIAKTLNSKQTLYCVFIDFEKCFDRLTDRFYGKNC